MSVVEIAQVKTSIGIRRSRDSVLQAIVDNNGYEERIRALADETVVRWPPTEKSIYTAKKKRKREEADTWMECHAQGMGVKDFKDDKIGDAWLSNPELLKSTRFINAIHM